MNTIRYTPEVVKERLGANAWRRHTRPLHSDSGSSMKAATFLEKLYDLGITPSNSRPREQIIEAAKAGWTYLGDSCGPRF
jgi:transposase InsO family protein